MADLTEEAPCLDVPDTRRPESTPSNDADTDRSAPTREATEEPSIFDLAGHSSPEKRAETPETSMENLASAKEGSPEATAAAIVSNDTPGGDDEKRGPVPIRRRTTTMVEDELESGTESDASSSFNRGEIIERASKLDTDGLYESYLMKLRQQASSSKRKKDNQSARLIKSLVDYVRVMEERINQLQKAKKEEEEAKAKPDEEETEKEVPATQEPGTEWKGLLLEMKFCHADGELDSNGDFLDNTDKKGTYTCETDPKYLIRVLYDWTEDVAQRPPQIVDGELPDPNQIDIIAFGILSEPVAKFFNKQLDVEKSMSDHSVGVYKELCEGVGITFEAMRVTAATRMDTANVCTYMHVQGPTISVDLPSLDILI